jgi:hypothetical protein
MSNRFKQDVIYFCGEYNEQARTIDHYLLVMLRETEIRKEYHEGRVIMVGGMDYLLESREENKRERMVTYHLRPIPPRGRHFAIDDYDEAPPPLDL